MKKSLIAGSMLLSAQLLAGPMTIELKDQGRTLMDEGLILHEKFASFIETNRCELGLQKGCKGALKSQNISLLKSYSLALYNWKEKALEYSKNLDIEQDINKKDVRFRLLSSNDSEETMESLRLQTAVKTLVYDEAIFFSDVINQSSKLTTILQYDTEEKGLLKKTFSFLRNNKDWKKLKSAHQLFEQESEHQLLVDPTDEEKILNEFIAKSNFRKVMDDQYKIENDINSMFGRAQGIRIFDKISYVASKIFGNTAGLVQTRNGKLHNLIGTSKLDEIKSSLLPLDIMFEKTPYRLTDKFIPGYFGHVAIWAGNESQLSHLMVDYNGSRIPLLNHPNVVPHLQKIAEGKMIIEALRNPGVTMNNIEHFMDIDDFLVLRNENMTEDQKAEYLLRAFTQVGKKYDFNFNIETEKEIVCSELISMVFYDQSWPTSLSLKRNTINPDQVAWKAYDDCYKPVYLYKKGREVTENLREEVHTILTSGDGIPYTLQNNNNCR